MISTDIHVQSSMKDFEKKAILIQQYNVREDKLLAFIPDAELDGFEREGEWAKQKYYT